MSLNTNHSIYSSILNLAFLGVALVFGQPSAHAQAPAPVPTFRTLSLAGSYGGLYYEMKGNSKLLNVSLDQGLSAYFLRPAGPTLEIFREFPVPPNSPPGTKPIRKAGLIAPIPPNVSRCLIVTIPRSSNRTDLLTTHTIPDDAKEHRAGTILFANLSSRASVVAVNGTQIPIAVGETKIVPCPPNSSEFLIKIALQKGNGWASVYDAEYSNNASLRGYVIFANYVADPDFKQNGIPPPALVTAVFEMSPEIPRLVKKPANTAK